MVYSAALWHARSWVQTSTNACGYRICNYWKCCLLAEPEWSSSLQCLLAACGKDGRGFEPQTSTNTCGHVCKYVDQKGLDAVLTPTVSRRCTRGKSENHIGEKACKGGIRLWTQGRRHQKSKNRDINGSTNVLQFKTLTKIVKMEESARHFAQIYQYFIHLGNSYH